jgi:hypothetical protein
MSNDRTTSLTELLQSDNAELQHNAQLQAQQAQQTQQAQQAPPPLQTHQVQQIQQIPPFSQEHVSETKKKNMMDSFKDIDYRSVILVFAIILVLTSGAFSSFSRSYISGSFGPDNRITLMGSVIAAIIGMILFIVVKFFGKF